MSALGSEVLGEPSGLSSRIPELEASWRGCEGEVVENDGDVAVWVSIVHLTPPTKAKKYELRSCKEHGPIVYNCAATPQA